MPNNPHDKFIKEVLAEPGHAIELLQEILPDEITNLLDWKSLRNEPDSFVDDELSEYYSDALFSVKCRIDSQKHNNLQLYLLFEHKSSPDKRIHFQLLNYLARIYSKQKKAQVVIPVVFYHGQKKWKVPESFEALFELSNPELEIFKKFIPGFEYALYDLPGKEMKAIKTSSVIRSVLHVMKNIWDLEEDAKLSAWLQDSQKLILDDSQEKILEMMLVYVYVSTNIDAERLKGAILKVAPAKGDIAMSTAEKLIEQGIEQGNLATAKRMLKSGAELEFVLQVTDLTISDLKDAGLIQD